MILDLKQEQPFLTDSMGEVTYLSKPVNPYYVLTYKYGYQAYNMDYVDVTIQKERLEQNFEPVENMKYVSYINTQKNLIEYVCMYRHEESDTFMFVGLDLSKQTDWDEATDDSFYKENYYKVHKIFYKMDTGDLQKALDVYNKLLDFSIDRETTINLVIKTMSGYKFKEFEITPLELDINTYYNDDFAEAHDTILKSLTKKSKGIIMLHGLAGTGKTNYIKYLTGLIPKKRFVFVPSNMVGYLSDPSFIENLIDNKNSVLVLEDCEVYLKDRKLGTGNDNFVSSLLNISDGILSDILSIQIICTFNNNLTTLDPALLRDGRLLCEYEFKALEEEKALRLIKDKGFDKEKIDEYTLAKIFNSENKLIKTEEKKKIGFG